MGGIGEFFTGSGARKAQREAAANQQRMADERREQDRQQRATSVRQEEQSQQRERDAKRLATASKLRNIGDSNRLKGIEDAPMTAMRSGNLSGSLFGRTV